MQYSPRRPHPPPLPHAPPHPRFSKNSRKRRDVTNMAPTEKAEVIQTLDYGVW